MSKANRTDIKSERDKTDSSLVAEREKTNSTFSQDRKLAESITDASVKKDREQADSLNTKERSVNDRGSTDKLLDERIRAERERSDEAVELERENTDHALEQERAAKTLLAKKLFAMERELTDKSLSGERTQTDQDALQLLDKLSKEIAVHEVTQSRLSTREEFLAIVSHDLRGPIGAITSCTELVLGDAEFSPMSDEHRHWMLFIQRNAKAALKLINDILETERIASGKLNLQLAKNCVFTIATESAEMFAMQAQGRNIRLQVQHDDGDNGAVVDADRIAQVFNNIIGNALKYTPEGGHIIIKVRRNHDHIETSIKDNGAGMDPEQLKRIFNRFSQLRSKNQTGLGLGLYIARSFVDAHEGSLSVSSKLNEGSCFTVCLKTGGPTGKASTGASA